MGNRRSVRQAAEVEVDDGCWLTKVKTLFGSLP